MTERILIYSEQTGNKGFFFNVLSCFNHNEETGQYTIDGETHPNDKQEIEEAMRLLTLTVSQLTLPLIRQISNKILDEVIPETRILTL